jgi:hypothetical protein
LSCVERNRFEKGSGFFCSLKLAVHFTTKMGGAGKNKCANTKEKNKKKICSFIFFEAMDNGTSAALVITESLFLADRLKLVARVADNEEGINAV